MSFDRAIGLISLFITLCGAAGVILKRYSRWSSRVRLLQLDAIQTDAAIVPYVLISLSAVARGVGFIAFGFLLMNVDFELPSVYAAALHALASPAFGAGTAACFLGAADLAFYACALSESAALRLRLQNRAKQ